MNTATQVLIDYAREVSKLATSDTTNEQTYYPAVRSLLADVLRALKLPSDVRVNTSERRAAGGVDMPDLGIYDGGGDYVLVCGEVKLPNADLSEMARSIDRNDQIGRYLARTGVVILCNVRGFGLLTIETGFIANGPVPPERRRLEQVVDLWSSVSVLRLGKVPADDTYQPLCELVETAVTAYTSIAEPETLARVLASQARRAKNNLPAQFGSAVRGLLDDFGKALGISFEGEEGEEFFRSSLVQTVFYGIFAGWALHKRAGLTTPFRWQDLPEKLTIPFLGDLLYDLQHPSRIAELNMAPVLNAAAAALDRVNDERFFQRLKVPSLQADEDPERAAAAAILYFYEPFLEAFDPELRKRLGVWYTPPEIVRYQVRKVDRLLRDELGCDLGFADERVVVLDPCCGTGAYLIEVLLCVAETLRHEGIEDDLADRLIDTLCRRIIGFEILTAPFVIAHLQLYLILAGLGVKPKSGERLAIFLTNALTGWHGEPELTLHYPELQQEHEAARRVKTDARIIVVLGNPPYNRFAGAPIKEESDLVDHYKGIKRDERGRQVGQSELFTRWGIRKHLLDDLYIRFFRLAEQRIAVNAEYGIVSFISNASFYTGRSHPIMRESLVHGFDTIWVDNLNGDKYRTGKVIPAGLPGAGTADQSVFTTAQDSRGIQVGTGITTMLKRRRHTGADNTTATVYFRDFWGRAAAKRRALLESLALENWSDEQRMAMADSPEGPRNYSHFDPNVANRWKLIPREDAVGYEDWPALDELFAKQVQGVNPNRGLDGSLIDMERNRLAARMREYFSSESFAEFAAKHPNLCEPRARFIPENVRLTLQRVSRFQNDRIVSYELFPLDLRWIYYETEAKLLNERRPELWDNLPGNEFLVTVPQPRRTSESRPLLASCLFDLHLHDRGSVGFAADMHITDLFSQDAKPLRPHANLTGDAWDAFRSAWDLQAGLDGDEARSLVRLLFRTCLAICHSPQYQIDHADSLSQDWAHVPIPNDRALFNSIAAAGASVATLLDPMANARPVVRELISDGAARLAILRKVGGAPRDEDFAVTIAHYGAAKGGWRATTDGMGDLYINANTYFQNVPEGVWRYELGGYPVLKKWLGYRDTKRRDGQPLTIEERDHVRSIVQRIAALLQLHPVLDTLYTEAAKNPIRLIPLDQEIPKA